MALAATIQHNFIVGDRRETSSDVTIGTYATGGLAYTPALFGMAARVDILDVGPTSGYVFETDYTNKKVKAYYQTDPAAAGGADVALKEVANSANLGSVVARTRAVGK